MTAHELIVQLHRLGMHQADRKLIRTLEHIVNGRGMWKRQADAGRYPSTMLVTAADSDISEERRQQRERDV
eukprot:SAG31_NODE_28033_length_416_cov_0.974763_2_plen_70_part_01